jgi:hypothetical protein
MSQSNPDIAIVLTAAIIVSRGSTAVADVEVRRRQYLGAARHYAKFAKVYFLEHSGFDLYGDREFADIPAIKLRSLPVPDRDDRGKGYREFHGIDAWYDSETEPPERFLKVTGRYLCTNVDKLLEECRRVPRNVLLFDRYIQDRFAPTSIFSVSWPDYGRYLRGLYRVSNDPAGYWVEHAVFDALAPKDIECLSFEHEPDLAGISGSSNTEMKTSRFKYLLKQGVRSVNRFFDPRFLYLHGRTLRPLKRIIP